MAKKGQFYILAAVILCIVIFGVTVTVNKIEQEVETTDFVELAQNYVLETPALINYAIYGGFEQQPSDLLSDFTEDFVQYARKKNPKLGLLYVYKEGDNTIIENYLKEGEPIIYTTETEEGGLFEFGDTTLNEIILNIEGEEFIYTVPTKLQHFGELHGTDLEAIQWVKLNIGGVPYLFDIKEGINFEVIIKGKSESGETEVICTTQGKRSGRLSCKEENED